LICVYADGEPFERFDTSCVMDLNEIIVGNPVLYPNPTQKDFQINLASTQSARVSVWDASGTLIYLDENYQSGQKIELSDFASGFYTARVEDDLNVHFLKLVLR
jgi:hypothetical protein